LVLFYNNFIIIVNILLNNFYLEIYFFCVVTKAVDHGTLRLVGGSSYKQGRVEVYISSGSLRGWGTVCDDGWDNIDAGVVCRQLGFGSFGSGIQTFQPSATSTVPIWLDDVGCSGGESSLIYCSHRGYGNHNCGHHEDAGVMCGGSLPS